MGVELVGDGKGGADFDVFLGKIVAVDENFADLVGVAGAVACFEEAGVAGASAEEEFDAGAVEALPLPNLVTQVQRRAAARSELFFEGRGVFGDFGFGEDHEGNMDGI